MKSNSTKPERVRGVYEKEPGSGVYWIRFSDPSTGKMRRERAGTKAAAKQLYTIRKSAAWQGHKLPHTVKTKAVTFESLTKDALAYSAIHKASNQHDIDRMKLLVDWFGNVPADAIKPQQIEKALNESAIERKWKPSTTNRYKALFSLVFRLAVENGKLQANPARLVRKLKEDNHVVRFLTPEEETNLKSVIAPEHPERWALVTLALNTGIRAGEQWKLRWSEVDRVSGSPKIALPDTKNGSLRYVPLNAAALEALRVLRKAGAGAETVCHGQRYREWFEQAVEDAKIKEFTWHCLRHTFASRLVMSGVDIRTVAELMGHKTIQMTMRYAHLAPQHQADAVSRLVGFGTGTKTDTALVTSA